MIGFGDFLLFPEHFATEDGDPEYQPLFDLNDNGAVDFFDFLIFASTYGKRI